MTLLRDWPILALAVPLVLAAACTGENTSDLDCEAGTHGCVCTEGDLPCRGDLVCNDGLCVDDGCVGDEGCTCFSNNTCNPSGSLSTRLNCENGQCIAIGCTPGSEGCACQNGTCASPNLTCNGQQCVSNDCPAGSVGCSCRFGSACDAPGATCQSGVCQVENCEPGELHCACSTGACASDDLLCFDGVVCIERAGQPGSVCRADGTCAAGNRCESGLCAPCDVGDLGCTCFSSGNCLAGGVCVAGTCTREPSAVMQPPAVPKCYSPCSDDLVRDGEVRVCGSDHLLEGCLDGAACVDGSCIAPGQSPASCASDIECPDHQACMSGRCYSNCEENADCPAGLDCHLKVCRIPCSVASTDCAEGQFCSALDGETGFCEPMAPSAPASPSETTVPFSLVDLAVSFNNQRSSGGFVIVNESDRAHDFIIRKASHSTRASGERVFVETNALSWLALGPLDQETNAPTYSVRIPAGESTFVSITNATTEVLTEWEGMLVIENEAGGSQSLTLTYAEGVQGRWSGKIYYFTSFGAEDVQDWIDDGRPATSDLDNAFLAKWSQFRNGQSPRTIEKWNAILAATQSGSWDWPNTREACEDANQNEGVRCYLSTAGVENYTDNVRAHPIPTGLVDFPFTIHLDTESDRHFSGRIHTAGSLQYSGNPDLTLRFAHPPVDCEELNDDTCFSAVTTFDAQIVVGGRTRGGETSCPAGFEAVDTPWLVEGFTAGTAIDPERGIRVRRDCLDTAVPTNGGESAEALNASLARSNPIPDGNSRRRVIELVDGGLINNAQLFVIFRERFESFLSTNPADDFSAYGYMLLTRSGAELEPEDYEGNSQEDLRPPTSTLGALCSDELLDTANVRIPELNADSANLGAHAEELASVLLTGELDGGNGVLAAARVHYLCISSVPDEQEGFRTVGYFDSGPGTGSGTPADATTPLFCPAGSTVRFFAYPSSTPSDTVLRQSPCQQDGSCHEVVADWEAAASDGVFDGIRLDPLWRCEDPNAVSCEDNRLDLRDGKQFLEAGNHNAFLPLQPAIEDAFRYRFRFRARSGSGLGFAPDRCDNGTDALPYCYDPEAIEEIADRLSCLTHLFTLHGDELGDMRNPVGDALALNFAFDTIDGVVVDGFERLHAELLVMLADDAFTRASAARFDLSGSAVYGFLGSQFEPSGVDLSGGAGYEMYELYRAAQTYQVALDRFYSLTPAIWDAINGDAPGNFVSLGTITAYIDRLIRASSQKSRVWSEIALRYRGFNRSDLATRVVERAYASAYIESVILSHLMLRLGNVVPTSERPQVSQQVQQAALGYRSSMLRMRKVYEELQADVQYFGFAPDEIPFPVLDPQDTNAFEKQFSFARQRAAVAADKEQQALTTSRAYDSDAVAFQNELTRIENTFEDELVTLCGTLEGRDGQLYPATRKYAALSDEAALLGNPCGFTGVGAIHQAIADLELLGLELESVLLAASNIEEQINIEVERAGAQCNQVLTLADFKRQEQGEIVDLQSEIRIARLAMSHAQRMFNSIRDVSTVASGGAGLGSAAAALAAPVGVAHAINSYAQTFGEVFIAASEEKIADLQVDLTYEIDIAQCDVLQIDSAANIANQRLRFAELELEALKSQYRIAQTLSRIQELRNDAERLMSRQEETEGQTINLEAARNNPNVRIYKNDAILNAERTFESALREAYKATKIYEYYTSESYGAFGDLFLVRMVAYGDISLESYLDELEDAFIAFEERFGAPSARVAVISVRDDVLRIPRYGASGAASSQRERIDGLRDALTDSRWVNELGHTVLSFSSSLDALSPLTRNHKISRIEAEIIGSRVGDSLGRLYLRSKGTGIVRGLDDTLDYYQLPQRIAVLNTLFNGQRVFDPSVYSNATLRDQPVVNSRWDIIFNAHDELDNQDIDLASLTDIRIFIYYSDFTSF